MGSEGAVRIGSSPEGSLIELQLDTAPGRPKAMLDGVKNDKSAKKLLDKITAAAA